MFQTFVTAQNALLPILGIVLILRNLKSGIVVLLETQRQCERLPSTQLQYFCLHGNPSGNFEPILSLDTPISTAQRSLYMFLSKENFPRLSAGNCQHRLKSEGGLAKMSDLASWNPIISYELHTERSLL